MEKKIDIICDSYSDEEFLQADGFDQALLGVVMDFNSKPRLVYSRYTCIEILMQRDEMSKEEADEYFDYNVAGSYVGERTPIWLDDTMFMK